MTWTSSHSGERAYTGGAACVQVGEKRGGRQLPTWSQNVLAALAAHVHHYHMPHNHSPWHAFLHCCSVDLDESFTLDCSNVPAGLEVKDGKLHIDRQKVRDQRSRSVRDSAHGVVPTRVWHGPTLLKAQMKAHVDQAAYVIVRPLALVPAVACPCTYTQCTSKFLLSSRRRCWEHRWYLRALQFRSHCIATCLTACRPRT